MIFSLQISKDCQCQCQVEKVERFDIQFQDYYIQNSPEDVDIQQQQVYKLYKDSIIVYYIKDKVILNNYEKKQYRCFEDHHKQITSIAVNPTCNLVASCDIDGKLLIWNPVHPQFIIFDEIQIGQPAASMTFSFDGNKLIICQQGSGKLLYNLDTKTKKELTGQSQVSQVSYKGTRPFAFSACSTDGQISFYDWRYDYVKTINCGQCCICNTYLQNDLVVGTLHKKLLIYTKNELTKEIQLNHAPYQLLQFDKYLIVVCAFGEIAVLDQEYNIVNTVQIISKSVKIDCKASIQLSSGKLRIYTNKGFYYDFSLQQLLSAKEIPESELEMAFNEPVIYVDDKYIITNKVIYNKQEKHFINNDAVISKILNIFDYQNQTFFITKTEIYNLNTEQQKLESFYKFEEPITNISSLKFLNNCLYIVYLQGIATLSFDEKKINILYQIQKPYTGITCSAMNNQFVAICLQTKNQSEKQKLCLLDLNNNLQQLKGMSSYFQEYNNLYFADQYLIANSGAKYCAFKIQQFEENDNDLWPFNAQMDYLQQMRAQNNIYMIDNQTVILCGQRGYAIWDLSVKSVKKHYKWINISCGVQCVQYTEGQDSYLYLSDGSIKGHQALALKALTKIFQYPVNINDNREFSLYIILNILDLTDGLNLLDGELINKVNSYIDDRIQDINIPIQSLQCLIVSAITVNRDISKYAQQQFDYTLDLIKDHGVDESYEPNSYPDQRNAASASIILYLLLLKYRQFIKINNDLLLQKLQLLLNYTNKNIHNCGGFTMLHDNELHGGGAVLSILVPQNIEKILNILQLPQFTYQKLDLDNIKFYFTSRHYITFNSRPNKDECLCYLFWIYGGAKLLDINNIFDLKQLRHNVLSLQYTQEFKLPELAILKLQKPVQLKDCRTKAQFGTYLYQKYGCVHSGFLQNMIKPDLMHTFAALAFLMDSDEQNRKEFDYSVFLLKYHVQ